MRKIKELTVFSNGDSSKINTWSNVPYFFTKTLISKGIHVNRIDISPNKYLRRIFKLTVYQIVKKIKNTNYDYFRSSIHFYNVRFRIKKAIKKHPNSDAYIFLTYSFSSIGLTEKLSIQFCDWTYDYFFKYFLSRNPDFFEKQCIIRENSQIEGSDLVFTLFPGVSEYMKKNYKNRNIHYLGNVINSLLIPQETSILKHKENSNSILFVGGNKYIEGARTLINAFVILKQNFPQQFRQLSLHIIGIDGSEFSVLPDNVHCYGYLDKGKEKDKELYYNLLKEAKLFVNTNPKWGAFSASIEAMFFYTPVLVTPYKEFVKTFSESIDFGLLCNDSSPDSIAEKINNIISDPSYVSLCYNAHNSVKKYTWDNFADKLILKIEEKLNNN